MPMIDEWNGLAVLLADMIEKYLPEERLEIKFTAIDENKRLLKIIPYGQRYEELCEAVLWSVFFSIQVLTF